jgi:hypothetical protein
VDDPRFLTPSLTLPAEIVAKLYSNAVSALPKDCCGLPPAVAGIEAAAGARLSSTESTVSTLPKPFYGADGA